MSPGSICDTHEITVVGRWQVTAVYVPGAKRSSVCPSSPRRTRASAMWSIAWRPSCWGQERSRWEGCQPR
ncbi:hypothetical protein FIBSPDRAFT_1018267 [Athelia psychrophila]|uniref:Uncharacterized protein n=1 Tax=Athelia psychrophila TaxID=1759441 RepID=A0A166KR19_9AGAM|nr:hypothetical protein FIBSPDRAFT_1018267 [Fibularhizoctonia sp. CBS 109695]